MIRGAALAVLAAALFALPASAQTGTSDPALTRAEAVIAGAPQLSAYWIGNGTASLSSDDAVVVAGASPLPVLEPWASVTKQVVAVMVMQLVSEGKVSLDAPIDTYLPPLPGAARQPTVRELLQHRAGLWNPDDSPAGTDGVPGWYRDADAPLARCRTGRAAPGGEWRYNNCDYLLLGAMIEAVTDDTLENQFGVRIAEPAGMTHAGFVGGSRTIPGAITFSPEDGRMFARFGAAGGLVGSIDDLARFDRALLDGRLLDASARETLWGADPALGYMALGQWVFDAPLAGCAEPVRLVERRGGIGRFQVRNILLPERGLIVILFVRDADFDFGEIWQGSGLSHDVLAAVACS